MPEAEGRFVMLWTNMLTGFVEEWPEPHTDGQARQYLPQYASAQMLYSLHRTMGKTVHEAMRLVLEQVCGDGHA